MFILTKHCRGFVSATPLMKSMVSVMMFTELSGFCSWILLVLFLCWLHPDLQLSLCILHVHVIFSIKLFLDKAQNCHFNVFSPHTDGITIWQMKTLMGNNEQWIWNFHSSADINPWVSLNNSASGCFKSGGLMNSFQLFWCCVLSTFPGDKHNLHHTMKYLANIFNFMTWPFRLEFTADHLIPSFLRK